MSASASAPVGEAMVVVKREKEQAGSQRTRSPPPRPMAIALYDGLPLRPSQAGKAGRGGEEKENDASGPERLYLRGGAESHSARCGPFPISTN